MWTVQALCADVESQLGLVWLWYTDPERRQGDRWDGDWELSSQAVDEFELFSPSCGRRVWVTRRSVVAVEE